MSWRNEGWNAEDAQLAENGMLSFLKREVPRAQRYERCSDGELGTYRVAFYFQDIKFPRNCLMIYDVVESSLSVCTNGASVDIPPKLHNYLVERFRKKELEWGGSNRREWKGFSLEEIKNL